MRHSPRTGLSRVLTIAGRADVVSHARAPGVARRSPHWRGGYVAVVVLVGAVVCGTTSAAAGRTTCESSLFGVGDSAGDQLRGNAVRHLRHGLSSGGFSGWCEWWRRRRRNPPADAVGDTSNGSLDNRGNVGEW